MELTVNLQAKTFDTEFVDYKSKQLKVFNNEMENINFFTETLQKEVKQLPRKQQKKAVKIVKITYYTAVSLLALHNPVFAASGAEVLPTGELEALLKELQIIVTKLGVGLAGLLLTVAGGARMFRQTRLAKDWSVDIIKGFGQILIAPLVIMLITLGVYYLFGDSSWFISPL